MGQPILGQVGTMLGLSGPANVRIGSVPIMWDPPGTTHIGPRVGYKVGPVWDRWR